VCVLKGSWLGTMYFESLDRITIRLVMQALSSVRKKCRKMWYVPRLSGASMNCRALKQEMVRYKYRGVPGRCAATIVYVPSWSDCAACRVDARPDEILLCIWLRASCCVLFQCNATQRCILVPIVSLLSLYSPEERLPVSRIQATSGRLRGS
jgi:hypothetical protein